MTDELAEMNLTFGAGGGESRSRGWGTMQAAFCDLVHREQRGLGKCINNAAGYIA